MKFEAGINVMPLKELLDPQGKAVMKGLHNLGLEGVHDVRVGKHITLSVDADSEEKARNLVEEACSKLLTNRVIEAYEYELKAV